MKKFITALASLNKAALLFLKGSVEDVFYLLGVTALTTGGFFISIPVGCFILGAGLISFSLIIGAARRAGGGK